MSDQPTAQVLRFTGDSRIDIPSARVLQNALDAGVEHVVVVGREQDGSMYVASASTDMGHILLALERAKEIILRAAVFVDDGPKPMTGDAQVIALQWPDGQEKKQ